MGKLSTTLFFYFLEIIQSLEGEGPRRTLLEQESVYDSATVLVYCLDRAKIHCLKWEKNKCNGLKLALNHLEKRNEAESELRLIQGTCLESGAEFLILAVFIVKKAANRAIKI